MDLNAKTYLSKTLDVALGLVGWFKGFWREDGRSAGRSSTMGRHGESREGEDEGGIEDGEEDDEEEGEEEEEGGVIFSF